MKVYLFGDVVVGFIFRVICYGAGRVVIAGFTFGRVRSESFKDRDLLEWHAAGTASDGTYTVSTGVTALIGFVVLASVLGVILCKSSTY